MFLPSHHHTVRKFHTFKKVVDPPDCGAAVGQHNFPFQRYELAMGVVASYNIVDIIEIQSIVRIAQQRS
jgi:hypothetical protein